MLKKIFKLNIVNEGFRREISLEQIYINTDNIISISDYSGASKFLESEKSEFHNCSFSLIKYASGNESETLIVKGKASDIIKEFTTEKKLLNG